MTPANSTAQHGGYIALLAVLVVGAAATAISLALLTVGTDSQRSALAELQSKQAHALAVACAQEALQVVHDNVAFSGTGSLTIGQGTCSYTVTITAGTTRTITASSLVNNIVKKIQVYVTIGTSSISIISWQDVS